MNNQALAAAARKTVVVPEEINIGPQPGPQTDFLSTEADICFFGGAAGGGKTFGMLLEFLRHLDNPNFGAIFFRRNTVQIRNEGAMWDSAMSLYTQVGGMIPKETTLEMRFVDGPRLKFAHLETEKTIHAYQGSQIPFIGFDEVTHFTEKQFFYFLSRMRSASGVPGYIRATCNPTPDGWLRDFIDWWIGEDGFPIQERCGKLRWFIRQGDEFIWKDKREDFDLDNEDVQPKSVTFIPSKLEDNQILLSLDPTYRSNLLALDRVDRGQLLDGNWNVRPSAGMFFRKHYFPVVETVPGDWQRVVRFWDLAATEPSETNKDPDYYVGLKLYIYANGTYVVGDLQRGRVTPLKLEAIMKNIAMQDEPECVQWIEQEPGSAGKAYAHAIVRNLRGATVRIEKPTKDKITRAKPVSAQAECGNVSVIKATWNKAFFDELENFGSNEGHDDQVDALSGAFNVSLKSPSMFEAM